MSKKPAIAALAVTTALTLASCNGGDRSPATTSESDPENTVTIGQTVEKMGVKLTLTKVTVNDTCKYGPGYDELKPGTKVIQYEATMENTTAEEPFPSVPTPLNEDGTEAVIPRSMVSAMPCMPTRSEDGTVYWHQGVKPNATRKIYQQQVVPDEVSAVRTFDRIFTLPEATTPTTSTNQRPGQPNPTEASPVPQVVATPEVADGPAHVEQAPVDSPPAPAQHDNHNETPPGPHIPNAMLDATVPNDCDGYLGAHEDPDESHC
ncbi:MAG: hypothetical protein L0K02_06955 [Corynebacterium sp.]|nr:hypothetical protein [Corynebacterium sp.]